MAPKNKSNDAEPKVGPEQQKLQIESKRLKKKALDIGLVTDENVKPSKVLGVSKALAKCNGYDIVKKSTVRKNRYLVIINMHLTPAAGGRLGTLSQLDTKNPVMYLDFPLGRLKLLGTLSFPRAKYIMMRTGAGQVLCEDIFETLLVFSEAWWVGKKEDNPEEKRLPMPAELQAEKPHQGYHFTYGAQSKAGDVAVKAAAGSSEEAAGGDSQQEPEAGGMARRPRRAAATRRKSCAEDDDGDDDGDEDEVHEENDDVDAMDGGSEGEGARGTQAMRQGSGVNPRRAATKRSYAEAEEEEEGEEEEEEEEEEKQAPKGRARAAPATGGGGAKRQKKATNTAKAAPKPAAGASAAGPSGVLMAPADSGVLIIDSDDEPEEDGPAGAKRSPASSRQRRVPAPRNAINLVSDSDDEVLADRAAKGPAAGARAVHGRGSKAAAVASSQDSPLASSTPRSSGRGSGGKIKKAAAATSSDEEVAARKRTPTRSGGRRMQAIDEASELEEEEEEEGKEDGDEEEEVSESEEEEEEEEGSD